jgi:hypothetical protein
LTGCVRGGLTRCGIAPAADLLADLLLDPLAATAAGAEVEPDSRLAASSPGFHLRSGFRSVFTGKKNKLMFDY